MAVEKLYPIHLNPWINDLAGGIFIISSPSYPSSFLDNRNDVIDIEKLFKSIVL